MSSTLTEGVAPTSPASADKVAQQYSGLRAGDRFTRLAAGEEDAVWQKREDGAAELIDRHGNVSFMTGKRCIIHLAPSEWVRRAPDSNVAKKMSGVIGGSWPSHYTEEKIEIEAQLIFEHAQRRFPSLTLDMLECDGPGHASNYELAWEAVEASRKYLRDIEVICDPYGFF